MMYLRTRLLDFQGGMMIKQYARAILVAVVAVTGVSAESWNVDKAHSSMNFTVKHMVVTTVHGKFKDFAGVVNWDGKDLAGGSVDITIQAGSITTDNDTRDAHLKSPAFFAVDSFPVITFKSSKVIPGTGDNFKLTGNLTIRGITKEVTFDCTFNGVTKVAPEQSVAGFSATTTINRQDFKVSWSKTLDSGGLVAGNEVKIEVDVELKTTPPPAKQ
jgi:polyisoprenoid-binding protein YceI